MINQKTNEDFNKEKPDDKGEFFTEGKKTADGVKLGNAAHTPSSRRHKDPRFNVSP